uniref:Innexin n=1 Tax=Rhabditophanes sp. KR3021 TaxID=114890 RepID=A0AC35UB99_9BILA
MVFAEIVGTLSFLQPQADDDIADRLHYYYTSTFLLLTAVLISLKMYGGRPMECLVSAEFKNSWEEYVELYCWSKNTYFVSFKEKFPDGLEERDSRMVAYYQWIPFYLVLSAFMFYSPCLIWRVMYDRSGIRLKDIMAFGTDRLNIQPAVRQKNVAGLAHHLTSIFRHRFRFGAHHEYHHKLFSKIINFRYCESFLTFLYIGIKILFLINVMIQLYLMNKFLQTEGYGFYGVGVVKDLINGRPWSDSGSFPRVTFCDFEFRELGNIRNYSVQCLLVINIFCEKIFLLLWLWYSILIITSIASLISWTSSSAFYEARKIFIIRRLELADVDFHASNYKDDIDEFVLNTIKTDGVFVLKMLTIHSGLLVCSEVVDKMWDIYMENKIKLNEVFTENISIGRKSQLSPPPIARRKTSVLVPLVTVDESYLPSHYHSPISHPMMTSPGIHEESENSEHSPVVRKPAIKSATIASADAGADAEIT